MKPRTTPATSARPCRAGTLLALALLLPAGAPVRAQQAPPLSRDEILTQLFGSLEPSTGVQLVTVGGVVEEGTLQGYGPEGVDLGQNGEVVPIGYGFVRSVSVQEGHGVQGALWGTATGALVGALFGMMYASFDCRSPSDCTYTEQQGALRGGILFGAVGGGAGFLLGRHQVHWHPIFP